MRSALIFVLYIVAVALLEVIEVKSTDEILRKPFSLIYFSASDCKFCEAFNPDFDYLSALYNHNAHFQAVKVDGRAQIDLVRLFDVSSFPTLKLYDSQHKQVHSYTSARDVEHIEQFIQEKTSAAPNMEEISSNVMEVKPGFDVDVLIAEKPVVIAFVSRLSPDWMTYYYPNHLYQRMSREFPQYQFVISFADGSDSQLMQRYHVSNIPSMVLVDKSFIKIHNTLSTNQMVNYKIPEDELRQFLADAEEVKEGLWFPDLDSLHIYADGLEYDGHKQWKGGMNVVDSRSDDKLDADEEYEYLLARIGL